LLVRRTLRLGVDWGGSEPGRAPVRADRLLVSLAPGQRETSWSSSLKPVDNIRLHASEDPRLNEEWRVDLSPLWHLTAEGIPMIHHQGRLERWLPT